VLVHGVADPVDASVLRGGGAGKVQAAVMGNSCQLSGTTTFERGLHSPSVLVGGLPVPSAQNLWLLIPALTKAPSCTLWTVRNAGPQRNGWQQGKLSSTACQSFNLPHLPAGCNPDGTCLPDQQASVLQDCAPPRIQCPAHTGQPRPELPRLTLRMAL
jgi:hypothetical protein